jgi:hypothetical protein
MSDQKRAVVELKLRDPKDFNDVIRWVNVAQEIGIPLSAPVECERLPSEAITVRTFLNQVVRNG